MVKARYALLQTPDFVLDFILDQTLTPAIAEWGVETVRVRRLYWPDYESEEKAALVEWRGGRCPVLVRWRGRRRTPNFQSRNRCIGSMEARARVYWKRQ